MQRMEPTSQREGRSHASSSTTPQTAESVIDQRLEVTFNLNGQIIGGKNDVKARCLSLLKTQIGLAYGSWSAIEIAKKDDLWSTLITEFKIPFDRKEEMLKEMGSQLKTWRRNLRAKYFKGLDINGIKSLKDKVPKNETIPLCQWNEFIKRESTKEKMEQREKAKSNRSKKTDVHCLGRQSYAEKTEEMVRKGRLREPPVRMDVFVEARKQRRTGQLHPNTSEKTHKLVEEMKSKEKSSSQSTLESDALTVVYGKDNRGRTRGVGPVSKGKVKAILPICSEIQNLKHSNFKVEQDMREMKDTSYSGRFCYKREKFFPTISNTIWLLVNSFKPGYSKSVYTPFIIKLCYI